MQFTGRYYVYRIVMYVRTMPVHRNNPQPLIDALSQVNAGIITNIQAS